MTNFDYDHQIMNGVDHRAQRTGHLLPQEQTLKLLDRILLVWLCH
jgi:hypothetical protein